MGRQPKPGGPARKKKIRPMKVVEKVGMKRRSGGISKTIPGHIEGRNSAVGDDERGPMMIRRAMHYRSLGMHLWEVAEAVSKEFGFEKTIHVSTISDWLVKGRAECIGEIRALAIEHVAMKYMLLEKLIDRWAPVAMASHLGVTRLKFANGEAIPELDENAYDEGLKAADRVIKAISEQTKLVLGAKEHNAPTQSNEQVNSFLSKFLTGMATVGTIQKAAGGRVIEVEPEASKLELRDGLDMSADSV